MKQHFILISILLCSASIFSQNIVISNKQWEGINYNNSQENYNSKFRVGTTEIEGKTYRELTFKVDGGWFEGTSQYYREEDDKVFRLYNGEEKAILDFSLNVGDTMRVSNDDGDEFDFVAYRTTDTVIQNVKRRKLELNAFAVDGTTNNPEKHVWVSGVGDLGFFFGNGEVYPNQKASPVFCVKHGFYIYGAGMFCPNFVLIKNTNTNTKEEAPNPDFHFDQLSKQIHIQNKDIERMDIYSISGFRISSHSSFSSTGIVDLRMINQSSIVVVYYDGRKYKSKILLL